MDKSVRKNTMASIFNVKPEFIEKQKIFPSLIISDPKEMNAYGRSTSYSKRKILSYRPDQ